MQCEMCGSEPDSGLLRVKVEGSVINVCERCARYGEVIAKVREAPVLTKAEERAKKQTRQATPVDQEGEVVFVISADYAEKIKGGREKLGLKQEELAKKLNERDSLLSKIETGTMEPSIKLARKLERFFNIKLIEEHKEEGKILAKEKGNQTTIGDLARLRKR